MLTRQREVKDHMARQETVLLFWDCPECGRQEIPGPTRRCPECFWWRDRDVPFYETPDSRVLSPQEAASYRGPDWICKVCGAANPERGEPAATLRCGNCDQWQVNHLDLGQTAPERLPTGQTVPRRNRENVPPTQPEAQPAWPRLAAIAAAVLAIALLLWGGWQAFGPRAVEATVLSRHWTTSVIVQEQRPVSGSGWTLPIDAYDVSTTERPHGTRQVQTGTRSQVVQVPYRIQTGSREQCSTVSLGDGTGERRCTQVPVFETRYRRQTETVPVYETETVYDPWYSYTVDRWQTQATRRREGTGDEPRQPPAVELSKRPYPQRARPPVETCEVTVRYRDRQQPRTETWTLACGDYDQLRAGDTATFRRALGQTKLLTASSHSASVSDPAESALAD